MQRAYSLIEVKSFNDDLRVIEGVASTPTTDRMGDVVEPKGAKFNLPLPLLWQHRSDQPVGTVEFAQATENGIPFRARLAKVQEDGELKTLVDKAWQSVKYGLVRGVSIGFQALEHAFMKEGGIHFTEWEWLELSLVTIPANAEATIQSIKAIDAELRAATGDKDNSAFTSIPGVTVSDAVTKVTVAASHLFSPKGNKRKMAKKTVAEQISAFEATRAAKAARLASIMEEAGDETLSPELQEEFDSAQDELKEIDAHLKRLAVLQKDVVAQAATVEAKTPEQASGIRGAVSVSVKQPELPKGTAFTRYAIALARAKGSRSEALEIARGNEQWRKETPEVEAVLKAAVNAGTTTDATWAAPLVEYQIMASEFVEFLRPQTIVGRIPGLRRVPFNIKMPRQTSGSSVGWVGEGDPKPVSALAFDSITLRWAKAAGIVVLTDELVRFSNPSAEALVRQDLADEMAKFLDQQFVDPSVAAVTDVSPASITNGASHDAATGTTAADLRDDLVVAFGHLYNANISPEGTVLLMRPTQALQISMLLSSLSVPEFPDITAAGGSLVGFQVITSNSVPSGHIVLLKPSEILLADDGQVLIDVSREASLQMQSDPSVGDYQTVSLWQTNMVGVRCERVINWRRRRDEAVYYITGANYGNAGSI